MVFDQHIKEKRCKLVILTGFFGSGKTTLIKHLIKTSLVKIGIIENDLAEINIDGNLLNLSDSYVQVISNACICCSGSKHIAESLDMMLSTHENLEYIFIETTGLADPFKLKKSLFGANVKYQFDYQGTICIVDSKHCLQRENIEEQIVQIAYSDFILVSKLDLITDNIKNNVYEFIKNINPVSKIDSIYNGKYTIDNINDFLEPNTNICTVSNNLVSLHSEIKTYSYSCDLVNPVSVVPSIIDFITKNDVYRCKGIMKFPMSRDLYIFHGVHKDIDLTQEVVDISVYNKQKSSFVFIGKNISEIEINKLFNSFAYSASIS